MALFTSPSVVQARAVALDSDWSSLAVDASRCQAGDPTTLAAFQADLDAWKQFFQANHDAFWGAGGVDTALDGWQSRLADWQPKIKALGCAVTGAPVTKPPSSLFEISTPAAVGAGVVLALVALILLKR